MEIENNVTRNSKIFVVRNNFRKIAFIPDKAGKIMPCRKEVAGRL
jgi:hypothetical protein